MSTSQSHTVIKYVKSNDDWVTLMKEEKMVVTNFTASGWVSSSSVASFFEAQAKDYPKIIFAVVDFDKKDEIAALCPSLYCIDVNALPIFQFYKRGKKIQELKGAAASVIKFTQVITALNLGEAFEGEKFEEEPDSEEVPQDEYGEERLKKRIEERAEEIGVNGLPHDDDRSLSSSFSVLQNENDKENHAGHKKKSLNFVDEDGTEQGEAEEEQLYSRVKKQKRSLAVEYTRLGLQFESALIQHKLAMEYYDFRSYYFVFLPVTLIATSITIIGFLIAGNTQDDDGANGGDSAAAEDPVGEFEPLLTGRSKQILSLVVGILGAVTTLFNAIGKRTNYQSQSDMHRSAVKALEKICLTVEFDREWFNRKVLDLDRDIENSGSDGTKTLPESLGADLKTHQASFKAMLDACCDSPVPYEVSQAFTLLEQIFCLHVYEEGSSDIRPLMYHYHKLWKEYSTYWLWPLKAPSIKVSRKVKEWRKERANYGDDDDDDFERNWSSNCCGKYWQIRYRRD